MNIRDTIAKFTKHIKMDRKLLNLLREYRTNYLITNSEFFSKPLTGTVKLYFKDSSVSYFFESIIDVNEVEFKNSRKDMDGLVLDRKISSDHFNLMLFYLTHKALNVKTPRGIGDDIAREILLIYSYRTMAALISSRFSEYLASTAEAYETYESLSDKVILKKLKSWSAYCDYRVNHMLDPKLRHRGRLVTLISDKVLIDSIAIFTSAFASTMNIIFSLHLRTLSGDSTTKRDSRLDDDFGTESNRADTVSVGAVVERVLNAIPYPSFKNPDIINVTMKLSKQCSEKVFVNLLNDFSEASKTAKHKEVDDLARRVLVWSYRYLRENVGRYDEKSKLDTFEFIKGGLSASRTVDESLHELRNLGFDMVKTLGKRSDPQIIKIYRNALFLYIFMFSMLEA